MVRQSLWRATIQTGTLVNDYYVSMMEEQGIKPPPANIGLDFQIRGEGIGPNSMGNLTSTGTYGKFGLGGTGFWVDPERDVTFVFLSCRRMRRNWVMGNWRMISVKL